MKKAMLILLAGMILLCFAACGSSATGEADASSATALPVTNTDEDEDVPVADLPLLILNDEPCVIPVSEGFNAAGYTGRICGATATYSFRSSTPDVTWSVYVLDEAFSDILRYLPQAHTPALEGNGNLEIAEGKYIYIYCSENSFTSTEQPSDASLSIDFAK